MLLPFDRGRLRERNLLDEVDEVASAQDMTPAERLAQGIELSDVARELALGLGNGELLEPDDLEEKARRHAEPLRRLAGR
jgi:hypothetical protein